MPLTFLCAGSAAFRNNSLGKQRLSAEDWSSRCLICCVFGRSATMSLRPEYKDKIPTHSSGQLKLT